MSHSLIYLQPACHSHPPPHIHYFIPGSNLIIFTNLFHHSLLAPIWTAFSDYTGPDLFCSTVFIFSYFSVFLFCKVDRPITDGLNTDLHLDIGNEVSLEKVVKFCYLVDMLDADGGCDSAVTASQICLESFVNIYPF